MHGTDVLRAAVRGEQVQVGTSIDLICQNEQHHWCRWLPGYWLLTWYQVSCTLRVQPFVCAETCMHKAVEMHAAAAIVLNCDSEMFASAQSIRCQWPSRRKAAAKQRSAFCLSQGVAPASTGNVSCVLLYKLFYPSECI